MQQALADARPVGGFDSIEHVVLLMQENRSFDHYFGTMPGVRGFSDPEALRLSTGKSVFYQPDAVNPDGEPNISDLRRRTFGDFTSAFRFGSRDLRFPSLPDTATPLAEAGQAVADNPAPTPPVADQVPPRQRRGWKPTI